MFWIIAFLNFGNNGFLLFLRKFPKILRNTRVINSEKNQLYTLRTEKTMFCNGFFVQKLQKVNKLIINHAY